MWDWCWNKVRTSRNADVSRPTDEGLLLRHSVQVEGSSFLSLIIVSSGHHLSAAISQASAARDFNSCLQSVLSARLCATDAYFQTYEIVCVSIRSWLYIQ